MVTGPCLRSLMRSKIIFVLIKLKLLLTLARNMISVLAAIVADKFKVRPG